MIYMPDANACIMYLNNRNAGVVRRMAATDRGAMRMCDVVKAEIYYGAYRSARRESNLAVLARFFAQFDSTPFDGAAAEAYGRLRAELVTAGTTIGGNDLMIAAIAVANDVTLVTHNVSEFSRVSGLRWEDWETDA